MREIKYLFDSQVCGYDRVCSGEVGGGGAGGGTGGQEQRLGQREGVLQMHRQPWTLCPVRPTSGQSVEKNRQKYQKCFEVHIHIHMCTLWFINYAVYQYFLESFPHILS